MAVRVDKWLWSVRVYKTRTKAGAACTDGRVLVNDVAAKSATKVGVGDVVTAQRGDETIIYVVRETIEKRVSAVRAAACVEDRSPPPEPRDSPVAAVFARRDRGAGRPTKRDRREINRLRGRD
ncbi:MAG: S4 domain-containing protein [Acidimicrobiales bacterium]|jgi:ribosome-associated heat shock protein Hsp15|nr:S4 domain-containing protein [Acidimicrobiales bacterium]